MKNRICSWRFFSLLLFLSSLSPCWHVIAQSSSNDGGQTFFEACSDGDCEPVRKMIGERPDLVMLQNEEGLTPLFVAIEAEHLDLVALLIDKGAEINARYETDLVMVTPLALAIRKGRLDIMELLLAKGSDLNIGVVGYKDSPFSRKPIRYVLEMPLLFHTVLMNYTSDKAIKAAELLIKHGADVNFTSSMYGSTGDLESLLDLLQKSLS